MCRTGEVRWQGQWVIRDGGVGEVGGKQPRSQRGVGFERLLGGKNTRRDDDPVDAAMDRPRGVERCCEALRVGEVTGDAGGRGVAAAPRRVRRGSLQLVEVAHPQLPPVLSPGAGAGPGPPQSAVAREP